MSETPRPQRPVFPEPPAAPSPAAAQPALTAPPAKQRRWRDDLHLAHTIANKVDSLTQARFDAGNFTVETKSDLTPVTEADREAERVIREQLGRARGRDSVLGEELPTTGHSSRQWVIDPIDGTKNSVRGVPVWATLIGLIEDGQCVVGLVSAPALGRRWWAVSGGGAWTGRSLSSARRLSVSGVDDLSRAVAEQETGRLTRVPGVGKKTAERLLLELKGKLALASSGIQINDPALFSSGDDILRALLALGYSEKESNAAIAKLPEGVNVNDGIRQALKLLVRAG